MKSFVSKLLLLSFFSASLAQSVIAHTDDSGVLGGLENNSDIYGYLNNYNYSLMLADHRYSRHDMYISSDKAVIVSLWGNRLQPDIYIIKPGYATNKGITVGMSRSDVEAEYGPLVEYSSYQTPLEPYGEISKGYDKYSGYYIGEYVGAHNSGLSFVFNKYTDKVVLIRYQQNRHGNSSVMSDVEKYTLLPYLL
jgi:putative lipoprotein